MCDRFRVRVLHVFMIFAAIVVLFRAVELRLPKMVADIGDDEMRYVYLVADAQSLKDFSASLSSQMIPHLDYVLRKMFWYPLLGFSERALRIPGFTYSLASVLLVFFLSMSFFRRSGIGAWLSVLLSAAVGAFLARSDYESSFVSEGRHYSLVSMLSVFWIMAWLRGVQLRWFFLLTVAFANSYFLSFPLIASAVVWSSLEEILYGKNFKRALLWILSGGGIIAFTIWANVEPWRVFLGMKRATSVGSLFELVVKSMAMFRGYFESYAGLAGWLVLCVVVASGIAWSTDRLARIQRMRCLVLALVTLPAFFLLSSLRTDYGYNLRYHVAFTGVAVGLLVVGLRDLVLGFRNGGSVRRIGFVLAALLIAPSLLPTARDVLGSGAGLARRVESLRRVHVPWNFTRFHRIYSELKSHETPILVIHNLCFGESYPLYYLKYAHPVHEAGHVVVDSLGCHETLQVVKDKISVFLKKNPKGLVVFDQKFNQCAEQAIRLGHGLIAERVRSAESCVWAIKGVNSFDQVKFAAKILRFAWNPELL